MRINFERDLQPKTLAEMSGNNMAKDHIMKWLSDFKRRCPDTQKAALINGPIGSGKTSLARLALKAANYDIVECDAADIRSSKTLKEVLNKVTAAGNVTRALHPEAPAKSLAMIVDDIESMNVTDKGGLTELIHTINPLRGKRSVKKIEKEKYANSWSVPIICICSDDTDKRSVDLSKDCRQIQMKGLESEEAYVFVQSLCQRSSVKIVPSVVRQITQVCSKDIRRMILIISEIAANTGCMPTEIISHYIQKDLESDLYHATDSILFNELNIEQALSFYDRDKSLLPLMIHENYHLVSKNASMQQDPRMFLEVASELVHYLSLSDIVEKAIYNLQAWSLNIHVGILGVYLPNLVLNKTRSINDAVMKRNSGDTIKFTGNLSKTSLQYSNHKNIDAYLNHPLRPGFNHEDLITLVQVFELLPAHNLLEKASLLKAYDLSYEDISKIKKTNRWSST